MVAPLKIYSPPIKLGVLGGGQLGRMLIPPALRLGVSLHFLDKDLSPCQGCVPSFHIGSITDPETVLRFGKGLDVLTIEVENVATQALWDLEERGVLVRPSARVITLVQDKLKQKEFYRKHAFPTADFLPIIQGKNLFSQLQFMPAVQKLRCGGYDGRGVKIITSKDDTLSGFTEPSLVERKIDFIKEISLIAVRNQKGEIVVYPPIEMVFHSQANVLEYLLSPAEITPKIEGKIFEIGKDLMESLGIVGTLAIEFFLTSENELFVNEISPRPHNSGHHTIDLAVVSQFEQHMRSICDFPLGTTNSLQHAAVINLLGNTKRIGQVHYMGLQEVLQLPDVYLHLYGKTQSVPLRKLGHITILSSDRENIRKKMKQVMKIIQLGLCGVD